jgi:uncharacterized protein (TIGR02996 family)
VTAQLHERLRFRGKDYGMAACPLEGLFHTLRPRPAFVFLHTACWRGYVGLWEVQDNLLFLTELRGQVSEETAENHRREFGLTDLFPQAPPDGVLADWAFDWFRVPDGEIQHYVHMGFESKYERDLLLGVHRGRLVAVRTVDNTTRIERIELTPRLDEVYEEEAPFIRTILANEGEHLPKLVYADWLDERSDPRGELLRLFTTVVQMSDEWNVTTQKGRELLQVRYQKILERVNDPVWPKLLGLPGNRRMSDGL